jgi:hypothetical protein
MKITIFTLAILTLFVGTCAASSYHNGFITGMMVEKAMPKTKKEVVKYNTVVIDTSLFEFPRQKTPVCRAIEVKEIRYKKIPFAAKVLYMFIMLILLSVVFQACSKDPEFGEFMLGYFVGQMVEQMFNDD